MALPTLVPQGSVDPFDSLQRDFTTVLNRFFGQQQGDGGSRLAPYGVDVREDAGSTAGIFAGYRLAQSVG